LILFCAIYYDLDNTYTAGEITATLWKNEILISMEKLNQGQY